MKQGTCQHCGREFKYEPANRPGCYCSRACHHNACRDTVEERFWKHINKTDTCWEWTGTLYRGYGRMRLNDKRRSRITVHRFSWELHNGPIPDGMLICHHCDNRCCVRPDHLFLGTHSDNALDSSSKNRNYKGVRASLRGEAHPMLKLTEQQVRLIRQEYADGINRKDTASRYGVVPGTIKQIALRYTWKHI